MADDDADAPDGWYVQVGAALREKPPADVARELPGLVDAVAAAEEGVDHYVLGVSFSTRHTCLDYAIEAVYTADDGEDPRVETVKAPTAESHRYVHFAHPPDPHFDASALRARLVAAVDRERREAASAAGAEPRRPGFADLWEDL